MTTDQELQSFICQPSELSVVPSVSYRIDGTPVSTIVTTYNFCTGCKVKIKQAMRTRIAYANQNLADGAKTDELNLCQPILSEFTKLLSDLAENAYIESQKSLLH